MPQQTAGALDAAVWPSPAPPTTNTPLIAPLHAAFLQALDAQLRTLEDASHIQYVAATAIGQYLQADRVGYAEDEGDGQHITVTRNFTRGVPGIEGRYAYDVYGEELLRNFVQGKSVVRNDLEHDPQLTNAQKHAHAQLQLGATVNVPLLKHNKLVAVMFMHQRHARNWQLHEVELLQAVAHRTWEAVQRTRTQQALAASQALINTLIAHLPGGAVFVVDLNLRYILARGEALAHAHFTPQDFEGKTLHEALPTKLATEYGRIYRKILQGETIEYEHHAHQHSYVTRGAPLRNADGRIVSALAVSYDITARKQAEAELSASYVRERERANELAALMTATPAVLWIAHDAQCLNVTGNPESYRFLRMGEDPINVSASDSGVRQQRTFWEYRDGKHLAPEELPLQQAVAQGKELRDIEIMFKFNDGQERHTIGNAAPLYDDNGQVRGAVAAFMDITTIKQAQQALQEADRRKNEFLAMLAHELRNPLAPVRNAVAVLNAIQDAPNSVRNMAQLIERQVKHMSHLVDDLLDVSRVTQGKITLQLTPVDLRACIDAGIEQAQPLLTLRRHQLHIDLPSTPVCVKGDATRLAQVVGNLLNNAAKYTPEGGQIQLSVQLCSTKDGPHEVQILVRDNGVGINTELLPYVFDLFTQADRSLDRSSGGLGIGLSLVKSLAQMHGGRVHATSEGAGKGSTFYFTLPVQSSAKDKPVQTASSPSSITHTALRHRVLVVDDNVDSADSLQALLEVMGHTARSAYEPLHALVIAEEFAPQIVVLDLGLPGMHGLELTRRLHALPQTANATLIALTGYGQSEDIERTQAAGIAYHLIKPVDIAVLQDVLNRL